MSHEEPISQTVVVSTTESAPRPAEDSSDDEEVLEVLDEPTTIVASSSAGEDVSSRGRMLMSDPATPSKWAVSEAFFFNHGANITFLTLMSVININMFVWGVFQFVPPHAVIDDDILRVTLPIARGSGRLVTWNIALLLLSGCKYFWTMVRKTPISLGFPVDSIMPYYHGIIALILIVSGLVLHSIPQIVNYATGALTITGDKVWGVGNDPIPTKQLFYTGILLFVTFSCFLITTRDGVRKSPTGFRLFWWTHVVGIVMAIPLLAIHGTMHGNPITIYFIAPPLALYLTDIVLRRLVFSTLEADTVELTAHEKGGEKVVKVVVKSKSFEFSPGQYAELKVPEISKSEWHPFTIASAPKDSGEVTFYTKAIGRWTNALYDIALQSTPTKPALAQIGIRGPYGAPAQNYFDYKHIVVIGSGIGVTPLLSIWQHLVSNGRDRVVAMSSDLLPKTSSTTTNHHSSLLPDDLEEKRVTEDTDVNFVSVTNFNRILTSRRAKIAYYASVLESMTVNICFLAFSLVMETVVFGTSLFSFDSEAASVHLVLATVSLLNFGSKLVLSCLAYGRRYTRSLVFFLESCIILLGSASWGVAAGSLNTPTQERSVAYFSFYLAFLILHMFRIFHICYATARPPAPTSEMAISPARNDENKGKLYSVTSIWVSPRYASMSFAIADLVDTVRDLPKAFSLQLFATRDTPADVKKNNPFKENETNHCLYAGRPDWDTVMHAAMDRAHATNPEGESVGVFFCGSPAIAATLQVTAQRVAAEHQYAHANHCHCRLVVRKENF